MFFISYFNARKFWFIFVLAILKTNPFSPLTLFCRYIMFFPSLFIIVLLVTVKLRLETMKTNSKKFSFKDSYHKISRIRVFQSTVKF